MYIALAWVTSIPLVVYLHWRSSISDQLWHSKSIVGKLVGYFIIGGAAVTAFMHLFGIRVVLFGVPLFNWFGFLFLCSIWVRFLLSTWFNRRKNTISEVGPIRRRPFQFSLGKLFLLILALSIAFAVLRVVGAAALVIAITMIAGALLSFPFAYLLRESLTECSHCRYIITDSISECPWCGTPLNAGLGSQMK